MHKVKKLIDQLHDVMEEEAEAISKMGVGPQTEKELSRLEWLAHVHNALCKACAYKADVKLMHHEAPHTHSGWTGTVGA